MIHCYAFNDRGQSVSVNKETLFEAIWWLHDHKSKGARIGAYMASLGPMSALKVADATLEQLEDMLDGMCV